MPNNNIIFPNESRPDLAAGLTSKVLVGNTVYIAGQVAPAINVAERSGNFSAAQVVTGAAVTDREAGTALSSTRVSAKDISYTCAKIEGRAFVNETDIKNFGGALPATAGATRVAGLAVIKEIEKKTAAMTFTDARYAAAIVLDSTNPLSSLGIAAKKVKQYGKASLVASEAWMSEFIKMPSVVEVLRQFYGDKVFAALQNDVETISTGLGVVLGVSQILIGDDEFWNITGKTDAAAVVALRPEMQTDALMTAKALPVWAASMTFLPDAAKADEPFFVDTVYLADSKENAVDVTAFLQPKEINEGGCVLVKLA